MSIKLNSKIFQASIMHRRLSPEEHQFSYPLCLYTFDLDELVEISKNNPLFAHNRLALISLFDKDYLDNSGQSIKEKVKACLKDKNYVSEITRIELISSPRLLNYVFNPVSFFYCYNSLGQTIAIVTEVNNTFGERHTYILDSSNRVSALAGEIRNRESKCFHVSPFFTRSGSYEFYFADSTKKLDVKINLRQDDRVVFHSHLLGKSLALNTTNIIKTFFKFSSSASLSIFRIYYQAAILYFIKKLPFYKKPKPSSKNTLISKKPSIFQNLCILLVSKVLSKMEFAHLRLKLPDGSSKSFGSIGSGPSAVIRVSDYRFFSSLVLAGDVGLGESYQKSYWDSEDLTTTLRVFALNLDKFLETNVVVKKILRLQQRLTHSLKRNTIGGSKKNIGAHYDLSNELFALFLGKSMLYSCAYFDQNKQSLEAAQQNKLNMIIDKAGIESSDHVLEIGCGWGNFAIETAKLKGCKVTGITLSKEQLQFAQQRVKKEDLTALVDFKLCDYREIEGSFDKIVSIEMIEAVGHQYYPKFFAALERLLKPNGLIVLQAITIPDQRYRQAKLGNDWIQQHIFPGGVLPSLTALSNAMEQNSKFFVEDLENIGIHYAATLREWKIRFNQESASVQKLGFDDYFQRTWNYYFSYCEAGFSERIINTVQLVLSRQGNKNLNLLQNIYQPSLEMVNS